MSSPAGNCQNHIWCLQGQGVLAQTPFPAPSSPGPTISVPPLFCCQSSLLQRSSAALSQAAHLTGDSVVLGLPWLPKCVFIKTLVLVHQAAASSSDPQTQGLRRALFAFGEELQKYVRVA